MAQTGQIVRKPVVAGQFYPDNPVVLRDEIKDLLVHAGASPDPKVRGLMVPHAGHMYSGPVAAEAYKTVEGRSFETVVIIAFLHRIFLRGVLVDAADFYETPLGRVPVDKKLANLIRQSDSCLSEAVPGDTVEEHSLEVQLPFLQSAVKDLRIVPVYMGEQSLANAEALASALAGLIRGKNALVVASTDLSHFHPYQTAVQKDRHLTRMIEQGDIEALARASQTGEVEACGFGPVISLLLLAGKLGWSKPELLRYANSGDVTGDKHSVVGYAAMAFRKA